MAKKVFDRSKYKATNLNALKKQEQDMGEFINRGGGRADYLKIEIGTNKFRIYPAHPDSESFLQAKTVHWIPQEVEEDDPKRKGKKIKVIKSRPIFNSRVHGGTEKDIIESYIEYVTKSIADQYPKDKAKQEELLTPLKDWKSGILPRTQWVCYADRIKGTLSTFGRLELGGGVKSQMNTLSITEDPDSPIATDPFTDPIDGKAILLVYNPNETQPKDKYKVTLEHRGDYELTDEQLQAFEEHDSLAKIFCNVYTVKDFDKAVEGLKIFDEQNGFDAFAQDDWLDICQEIAGYYPEITDEAVETEEGEVEEILEEEDAIEVTAEEDELDGLDRQGLLRYIKTNTLDIKVLKSFTDDVIRDLIRDEMGTVAPVEEEEDELFEPTNELPFDEEEAHVPGKITPNRAAATTSRFTKAAPAKAQPAKAVVKAAPSKNPRLAAMQAKLQKNAGKTTPTKPAKRK